ncbi:MAG: ROK family protein [Planctomycetota bacterium]
MATVLNVPGLVACHALPSRTVNTLAIDVGGSGLKATVVDESGTLLCERVRIDTPVGSPPDAIVALLVELVRPLPTHDRVSVGFPGMVRHGVVRTAPNLGHDGWHGFDLAAALQRELHRPVRVANDADVQGLAVIRGQGVELVVTLGTGFGTALYDDGRLCPHLELAHLTFRKGETYDEHLGNAARKAVGNKKWEKRVWRAIANLRALTHFDHLYLGGGNSERLERELPADISIVDNVAGLAGGAKLWLQPE